MKRNAPAGGSAVSTSHAFRDDPLGHGGNQCGHMVIGASLAFACGHVHPWAELAALAIGGTYFLLIEWAWQRLVLFWDSVEDAVHVTFGASLAFLGHPEWLFWAWVVVLIFGMWRRM